MREFLEVTEISQILLEGQKLLDVRAEQEFLDGSIPGASNLPLLNDPERAQVGTCYKREGQSAAIKLGEQLVSGNTREDRIAAWVSFVRDARPAALYCARGGLRSQIAFEWIRDAGVHLPRIRGGYKALRNFLLTELQQICSSSEFVLLGGRTGAGKTRVLGDLVESHAVVDLEQCALHRGSTFGKVFGEQPTQSSFENRLIVELMRAARRGGKIILEAESRRIGRDTIPEPLWHVMENCPVVVLEEPLEVRIEQIENDYVSFLTERFLRERPEDSFQALEEFLAEAVRKNSKRLGGERTAQLLEEISAAIAHQESHGSLALHRVWIARMLQEYYDPFYDKHGVEYLDRVVARGSASELRALLPSLLGASKVL